VYIYTQFLSTPSHGLQDLGVPDRVGAQLSRLSQVLSITELLAKTEPDVVMKAKISKARAQQAERALQQQQQQGKKSKKDASKAEKKEKAGKKKEAKKGGGGQKEGKKPLQGGVKKLKVEGKKEGGKMGKKEFKEAKKATAGAEGSAP